jgi:hypothetical protein
MLQDFTRPVGSDFDWSWRAPANSAARPRLGAHSVRTAASGRMTAPARHRNSRSRREPDTDCSRDRDTTRRAFARRCAWKVPALQNLKVLLPIFRINIAQNFIFFGVDANYDLRLAAW